ncbi:ankyrin repeat and SAM domain-containing protein 6-like isoform X2 [Dysidea avara]
MQAAYYGWLPAVGRLVEGGAEVNDVNSWGTTALLCACKNGFYSIAEMLIKKGANVNVSDENRCGFTPLMAACQSGNEQMVRLLLTHGANPNAQLKGSGWTALMLASLNNHKEVVKMLLTNGAKKQLVNASGKNAITICCEVENDDISAILNGGKPYKTVDKKRPMSSNAPKKSGAQVDLFEASKQGNIIAVDDIVSANKQAVHVVDKDGATPLMFAAMRGHVEVCRALVEAGSNVDAQDFRCGWTAFMQAVHHRQHAVAELLIQYGADVSLKAMNGCSAFEVATFNSDSKMIQLIASTAMGKGKKGKQVDMDKANAAQKGLSLMEKRARLKSGKMLTHESTDVIYESPQKEDEGLKNYVLKKHQSDMDFDAQPSPTKLPKHASFGSSSSSVQMVPAPPDFSMTPSLSVLVNRVSMALNTADEQPKPSEAEQAAQRFPTSRQQSKNQMEKIASTKQEESSPVSTRKEVATTPVDHGSPKPLHHPVSASPPTTRSSFQKFLMKKSSQGNVPSELAVAKTPSTADSSPPKTNKNPAGIVGVVSDFKKPGASKELPTSIFNLLAKNAPKAGTRNKANKHPYGNVGNSNDLIANLAMKYGKQGGVAAYVQDSPPVKHHTKQLAAPSVANVTPSITEDSDLSDVLKQYSLDRFITIFEENEVDLQSFLTMTNSDLEEVGITDPEEKLYILDAIYEIKDKMNTPTSSLNYKQKGTGKGSRPSSFNFQDFHW